MASWSSQQPANPFGDDRRFGQFDPEAKTGCGALWVVLICSVLVATAIAGFVYFLVRPHDGPGVALEPEKTLAEEMAETSAAFAREDVGIPADQLSAIQALFDKVEQASRDEDVAAFRALVDFDHLYARIKQKARGVSRVQLFVLRQDLRDGTQVGDFWLRCRIRYVQRSKFPDRALVYTHFFDDGGGVVDHRWWIVRRGGEWRIGDWERIDLGMSESEEWALIAKYYYDDNVNTFYDADDDSTEALEAWENGDSDAAEQLLRQAERRSVLPEFQGRHWVTLGYCWRSCGKTEEALACFRRVTQPDATPGAYLGQAMCHSDLGNDQEVVDLLTKYEAATGPVPDACRMKATALDNLGRTKEAAHARRAVLLGNPDDRYVLNSLRLALEDDEKGQLGEFLARCSEPLETAQFLAESSSYSGDKASLHAIVEFLQDLSADSALESYVAGLVEEVSANHETAAGLLLTAVEKESDAEKAAEYLGAYFNAMLDADRPVEGYEAAPDPRETFLLIMRDFYDEELLTSDEARKLVAAHGQRVPDDPWLHYYAGRMSAEDEKYADAVDSFAKAAAAMSASKEPVSEEDAFLGNCRDEQALALLELGRGLEAYRTLPPRGERFGQLARACDSAEKYDDLCGLVEAHGKDHPDDPWLQYSRALLMIADGQLEQAEKTLDEIELADDDNYLAYCVPDARIGVIARLDDWPDFYQQAEDPESFFDELANELDDRHDWKRLKSLIDLHRHHCPQDWNSVYWAVELFWQQSRYQEIADRRDLILADDVDEEEFGWQRSVAIEYLVRSLLRMEQGQDALSYARRLHKEDGDPLTLILCHVSRGDVEKTRERVAEYQELEESLYRLYNDVDAGPGLRSDAFAEVREDFPLELPYDFAVGQTVMLLRRPAALDAARVQALLAPLFASSLAVSELPSADGETRYMAVSDGRVSVCLSLANGPLVSDGPLGEGSDWRRRILQEQQAWVMVSGISWAREANDPQSRRLVFQVVEALLEHSCLGLYLSNAEWVLPDDAATRDLLAGRVPLAERFDHGEPITFRHGRDRVADERSNRQFDDEWKRFVAARREGKPDQGFYVRVALRVGAARESVWMKVGEIREDYGYAQIEGVLESDSLLVPDLHTGVRLVVEPSEINAWRYSDNGTIHRFHRAGSPAP